MNKYLLLILILGCSLSIFAQGSIQATLQGKITDAENEEALEFVNVFVVELEKSTETDLQGFYRITIPADSEFQLIISRVGYKEVKLSVGPEAAGTIRQISVKMVPVESDFTVTITDSKMDRPGMIRENVEALKILPSTTGNLESILPHIALGASGGTGGELSSQYTVRGGNYDENLIYVNDFEIYRPQLIRSGQQEGLTFANIDLIRDISFSSGGFQAKYGDKMSSVLDVRYKLPEETQASVSGSFLGGSAHVEGSRSLGKNGYRKFRYLVGARYKTTRYLLGSLDIQGEYIPDFYDVQAYLTYDLSRDWQLAYLGNFNSSVYQFTPTVGSSAKGLIDFTLNLRTRFQGREVSDFTTTFHGTSLTWLPDRMENPLYMKFMVSTYQSNENERIDIIGDYDLVQIETNPNADNAGEPVAVLGSGVQHLFARNYLQSNVTNVEWKGGIEIQKDTRDIETISSDFIQWGIRLQFEEIDDRINEWERLDSALYSLPFDPTQVLVNKVYKSENFLQSGRLSMFIQDIFSYRKENVAEWQFSYGIRANYWTLNKEWIVAPRAQVSYKPLNSKADIAYRFSTGIYHQPPFYRELRRIDGTVNEDVRAQKSAHILGGFTYDFETGKDYIVKYRLIAEVYYKHLWDIVSYDVENVRIRYSGENDARGYVTGLDLRLNGEFVPGVESWFNVSLLRAREQLLGVQHLRRDIGEIEAQEVSDVPRPTDQAMIFSVYFQDYLPRNENLKVHMNFTYGTGLPFGLPENNRTFRNTYRFTPYRRVDIGFSFLLWDESWKTSKPNHFLKFSRNAWLSLEVFNLLQMQNVANNTWVKSVFNQQYAIPNYLTSRRINLRFRIDI